MKRFTLSCFVFFIFLHAVHAQDYHTSLGVRSGKFNDGISFKHMFDASNPTGVQIEAYRTYIYSRGYTAKIFFIKQHSFNIPLLQIPLDFVYGLGAHGGYFPYKPDDAGRLTYGYKKGKDVYPYYKNVVTVGIDATLQVEYQIPERNFPVTCSFDLNPWFEFINKGPEWIDVGLSLRYAFGYK